MNCDYGRQIHAYHDGELSPEACRRMENHLDGCSICQRELNELRQLSDAFGSAVIPQPTAEMMTRLHDRIERERQSGLIRVVEIMTGAAAAILLIGLTGLFVNNMTSTLAEPGDWDQAIASLQAPANAGDDVPWPSWLIDEPSNQTAN